MQRPGLKDLFDIDLKNVRVLAQWLQRLDPKSDGAARDWVAIYDECSRILYQEIDYALEGANADRFRKMFAASDWIKVRLVQVFQQWLTEKWKGIGDTGPWGGGGGGLGRAAFHAGSGPVFRLGGRGGWWSLGWGRVWSRELA